MQAYEGFFRNGRFFPTEQEIRIPENKRAIVMLLNEPAADSASITAKIAEFDRMVDASVNEALRHEDFERNTFGREPVVFSDEG